ncbi:MAG: IclR family transcriptional regulator [Gordonia sp. (in: high G+C Gram-positive bacteria)]|uniref:IclR family transcriptional regulator n=1 Tax=Gordonia sp. (in: high G+C Gram-positive bacteria) TaxID=84139 RepID=UPI0039E70816
MGNSSGIGVLDKSVLVLTTVADRPCNLAELTEATGLPRATAHRLAVGLETHQLLTRDPDGRWIPGPTLNRLAASAHDVLREAALPVLQRLQSTTGESVQIYQCEGDERVCFAAVEPPTGLRNTVPVGSRLPMTAGSAAKVLSAFGADSGGFDAATLTETRSQGWAQSVGERAEGVASVSAPVLDASGTAVAAVSVSGPIDRMTRHPGHRWADDVVAAAGDIHRRLHPS